MSKIPGNSRGNFSKDTFPGIPERDFPVALFRVTFRSGECKFRLRDFEMTHRKLRSSTTNRAQQ